MECEEWYKKDGIKIINIFLKQKVQSKGVVWVLWWGGIFQVACVWFYWVQIKHDKP